MESLKGHLFRLVLLLFYSLVSTQKLSPTGRNVCLHPRDSSLVCCSGWAQQGDECIIPLCQGEAMCTQNEVCVHPGVCRCKPGFFGFQCKTRCPSEFWGSDCSKQCLCHPHGYCDPVTGQCTCLPTHWGTFCQNSCTCGRHGRCDPLYGNCTCDDGWWSSTCSKICPCHYGTCDPSTGHCLCKMGYWGKKCGLECNCYDSPCHQHSGKCQCKRGTWGRNCERHCICNLSHGNCDPHTGGCLCEPGYKNPTCQEPCSPGYYGSGCTKSCGHCEGGRPCSKQDGSCDACDPGWSGLQCDLPCPVGFYGNHCKEVCPHCRKEETCDALRGTCVHCDPGWTGPRCDQPCSDGTFGHGCRFICQLCINGRCDHVTGSCICYPGFHGERCNSSCPNGLYGVNCSSACDCDDNACHPTTGACPYSIRAVLLAGLLISSLVLILVLLFCCCCCGSPADGKNRVAVEDGSKTSRMKHHVYAVLANMSSAMPCLTLWSSGLPRVTVSHHDPELTFNHSFIEPPSSGWITDSFETDEDGEAVYCVPPREADIQAVAGGEFQELSSKFNVVPDPSAFSSEDMALAFDIPRTSSIAKSKRPSVSFAEGTKFNSKERRGSAQEPPPTSRKPKGHWGVLMLSTLQGAQESHWEVEGEKEKIIEVSSTTEKQAGNPSPENSQEDSNRYSSTPSRTHLTVPGSRQRTLSSSKKSLQHQASSDGQETEMVTEKVTTIYVTVGKAPCLTRPESSSEGLVQTMLRRLGSLQRQRDEGNLPKSKEQAVTKPPCQKLGARATAWEQAASTSEVCLRKPSRRKQNSISSPTVVEATDVLQENSAPKRPMSSTLKNVPESPGQDTEAKSDIGEATLKEALTDSAYETVALSEEVSTLSETNVYAHLVEQEEGPNYENVHIKNS